MPDTLSLVTEQKPGIRIAHERADPALSNLVHASVYFVETEGACHEVLAWSLEGVERPMSLMGDRVHGTLVVNFQGFDVSMPVVLKAGGTGEMLFDDLGNRQLEVLREFYRGLQSGRMSAIDGVIRAIDVPLRKVPMTQTEEDIAGEPRRMPRWMRAIGSLSSFVAVFAIVASSIAYVAFVNINFVTAVDARVVEIGGAPAIEGWIAADDVLRTWTGQEGTATATVEAERLAWQVDVAQIVATPPGDADADTGARILVRFTETGAGSDLTVGAPVELRLDRALPGSALVTRLNAFGSSLLAPLTDRIGRLP